MSTSTASMYKLDRGDPESSSGKPFDGTLFKVRIIPSKSISLAALGFFGIHPYSLNNEVLATITITGENGFPRYLPPIYIRHPKMKENETIRIKLPRRVTVPGGQLVEIGFQLDPVKQNGHPLLFWHLPDSESLLRSRLIEPKSEVSFDFLSSSAQIKEIFFEVA